ncbi:MAG: VacJ family lipoprotein [Alphaproteobacteria bacterium]|nr:VacJ family lipoprotein [Alphaproteobacteria bacterium]
MTKIGPWRLPDIVLSSTCVSAVFVAMVLALSVATTAPAQANEPASPSAADSGGSSEGLLSSLEEEYAAEEEAVVEIEDPLEPINRAVFGLNLFLDAAVVRPIAYTYRYVTPPPFRVAIGNVVNNSYGPVTIVNSALQGDRQKFGDSTVRFLMNTTLGFGGLLDIATLAGLPQHYEDFGQTLAVHGVPSGPYMVAPILGPGSPRHFIGRAVDYVTNPLTWLLWDTSILISSTPTAATLVTEREANIESVEGLRESSLDFYEGIKSTYAQNRHSAINDGDTGAADPEEAGFKINPSGAPTERKSLALDISR